MSDITLLVVDDSEFDRKLLVEALKLKGDYNVLEASSGERCLEILEKISVSLILMDGMMPGIHGSDVLTEIRKRYNAIELPIIMVTSMSDDADVVKCLRLGANDYIVKPVNFEIGLSRIKTHLMLAEASKEMSKLKEMAALDALITTYNHEINNPLTIALGCLMAPEISTENRAKLERELWRISKIVKKIEAATREANVEFAQYGPKSKMLRLR